MLGKVQVGTIAFKTLSTSIEPKNVTIELKLDNVIYQTNSLALFQPQWFVFMTIEEKLHTQPLHISLIDESSGRIAKAYLTLSTLLLPKIKTINKQGCPDEITSFRKISGWIPLYDDNLTIIGEVNITVNLENFLLLSPRVQFFFTTEPQGYYAKIVHGFVDESIIKDLEQDNQTALESIFIDVTGELQNKLKLKVLNFGANAVLGYKQSYECRQKGVIVIRGKGTAVTLVRDVDSERKYGDNSESLCLNTSPDSSQSFPPPIPSSIICNNISEDDDNHSNNLANKYPEIRELEQVALAMAAKTMFFGNMAGKKKITSKDEDSIPSYCNLAILSENCSDVKTGNLYITGKNLENDDNIISSTFRSDKYIEKLKCANRSSLKKSHVLGKLNYFDSDDIDHNNDHTNEINDNPFKLLASSILEQTPNINNDSNLQSNRDEIGEGNVISDVMKNVHIDGESLVKGAMQSMLLAKVGTVGTCTPPVSPRESDDTNTATLKQSNGPSNSFSSYFSAVDGNGGINKKKLTMGQENHNSDISEVLRSIEVKDESLVKTAIQTMLLAKVGVIETCTPSVTPRTRDNPSSCPTKSRFFPPSFKGISTNNIKEQNMEQIVNQMTEEHTNEPTSWDATKLNSLQENTSSENSCISEALQGINVEDQSLIKTAVQTMLLTKVGVIGTCTPPVSPKRLDFDGNCLHSQDEGEKSEAHLKKDSSDQAHGIYISPEDVDDIQGIPDAIQKVEIKDGGLVKTAIQAMLLDKVSLVGTYTPPTSPSLRSSIDAQFAFPRKKKNMPKSASHVNFADYVKKRSRETVLGVPFTSVANLKAEILKRQQSQPCFTDSLDLMQTAQMSSGITRNGQNRMSDTQLDKPIVRSMLNESLEKKNHKFRCFHLKRKKLFSFLHKTPDCCTNERKEHKSILSRIFHRKTKDAKSIPPYTFSSSDPHHSLTNTTNNINSDPSDIFESVPINTGSSSNNTNNSYKGHRNSAMQNAANFQQLTKNLHMDELISNDVHRRSSDSDVSIRAGVSLIGATLGREKIQKQMNSSDTLIADDVNSDCGNNKTELFVDSKSESTVQDLCKLKIPITASPCIQNGIISRFLGNLNFFLMIPNKREEVITIDILHKIIFEIAAILRGHIIAMGGNALVSLFMDGILTEAERKGNFLINVGGDVVSYIAADT